MQDEENDSQAAPATRPEKPAGVDSDGNHTTPAQRVSADRATAPSASSSAPDPSANTPPKQARAKVTRPLPQTVDAPPKSAKSISFLALLLAVIALSATGYQYWLAGVADKEQALLQQIVTELAALEMNVAGLADIQTALKKDSAARADSLAAQFEQRTADLAAQITEQRRTAAQIGRAGILAEAQFLVRSASYRLEFERDVAAALNLLKIADELLRTAAVDDLSLYPLRSALANDISKLERTKVDDLQAVLLALQALQSEIPAMTAQSLVFNADAQEPDNTVSILDELTEKLSEFVRIREYDPSAIQRKALLDVDREYFWQINLRILIAQAQLALLSNKPAEFASSLETLRHVVRNEIGPDAPNYVALQTVLESLLALSPWPEQLPEITESLQAFANATEMLR